MRTAVELPSELMRQAKALAAALGEPLKALFTRAVASEIGRSVRSAETGTRVRLPLFGNPEAKAADISEQDIARALAADDLALTRIGGRSRKRKRK